MNEAPDAIKEDVLSPVSVCLEFPDNQLMGEVCGELDAHLIEIEKAIGVQIIRRGNQLVLGGRKDICQKTSLLLNKLYVQLEKGGQINLGVIRSTIHMMFDKKIFNATVSDAHSCAKNNVIKTRKAHIEPRTKTQERFINALLSRRLVFGLGVAGTGKTYLALAVGVKLFMAGMVDRIILSRPAVEAGERLGFLPGDIKEKADPYMQPLYDALHDFLPSQQLTRMIGNKTLEIAPLAFMRGRTLNRAFIVLDEAQNTTIMQMKMFLTRFGEGTHMVVTGDMSQIDLPKATISGLVDAECRLKKIEDIAFVHFSSKDVVRHPLVAQIVEAYDTKG